MGYINEHREPDPNDTYFARAAYQNMAVSLEARLFAIAILGKALEAVRKLYLTGKEGENDGGRGTALEALCWIYSDEEDSRSFISICDLLKINPDYIRRKLREISVGLDHFCPIRRYDYRAPENQSK